MTVLSGYRKWARLKVNANKTKGLNLTARLPIFIDGQSNKGEEQFLWRLSVFPADFGIDSAVA